MLESGKHYDMWMQVKMDVTTDVAKDLADALRHHRDEIAELWAQRIHRMKGPNFGEPWQGDLLDSTYRGVDALIIALETGSYEELAGFVTDISFYRLQHGFESSEVIEGMMYVKEAATLMVVREYNTDPPRAWAMLIELDTMLRWMVAYCTRSCATGMQRQLKQQSDLVGVLLSASRKSAEPINDEGMLRLIAEAIVTVSHVPQCSIYRIEHNRLVTPPICIHSGSLPKLTVRSLTDYPLDPGRNPFIRTAIENRVPVSCADARNDERIDQDWALALGVKAILAVPLVISGRTLALAVVTTFATHADFTEEQLALILGIADIGALVVENVHLNEESDRRLAESESIRRINSALLQDLETEEALEIVCTESRRLIGAGGSAIYFLDDSDDTPHLQLIHSSGSKPTMQTLPLGNSLGGRALQEGRPMLANDPATTEGFYRPETAPDNVLAVPLSADGRTIGVLYLANSKRGFTENDARVSGMFADQGTLAIESARLHEQVRNLAALEERERLSREIHDNLAQALSILKLLASETTDLLDNGEIERAKARLAELKSTTSEAHADAREAILSLRTSPSSAAEFLPALEIYLNKYRSVHGVNALLITEENLPINLPPKAVIHLTRIIQEALANVRKHAHASQATIQMRQNNGHLCITVEDDGIGFDPIAVLGSSGGGVGLQVMSERAESLGGSVAVEAHPGQGTRVVIQVPHLRK